MPRESDADALDLIEGDGIAAPVIEPGGLGVRMCGHALRVLELGLSVLEIRRNPGAPEGVIADAGRVDPCLVRPALDHCPGPLPVEAGKAERLGLAVHRADEGTVGLLADACGLVLPRDQSVSV